MKNRVLILLIAVLVIGASGLIFTRTRNNSYGPASPPATISPSAGSHSESAHAHSQRVPAYQTTVQPGALLPTLAPGQFIGKTRLAYQAAKEIPQTLAQLPCYCECDEAFGHKSLQSCYVDTHASQCAVCVDEALLAYKLQKEEKMTPEQIRRVIIEKFSSPQ
jgi:hypothetical protein